MEEVRRIIPFLERRQARVIYPEGRSNAGFALVGEIVQVHPSPGERRKSLMQALNPRHGCFSRPRAFLECNQAEAVAALPEAEGHFGFGNAADRAVQVVVKRNLP